MTDNFLQESFDNAYKDTKKMFSEVFKIENTNIGLQIVTLIPIRINSITLKPGKILINGDATIRDRSILELKHKYLVGKTNIYSNVFDITDYQD